MRMSIVSVRKKNKATSFLKYILCGATCFIAIFVWVNMSVRPFIISVAEGYATNVVSNTLNELVNEIISEENYRFVNVINNAEGEVAAVTMNSTDANAFVTRIVIGLKNKIEDMDEVEAKIPLGNFTSYPFLAGLGPEVPVKFLILSNSDVRVEENFSEKGINQTLYTVSLCVDTKVGIYIPTMHSSTSIEAVVPLAQTLIVGNVPDSYTNVEGMEGSVQEHILDIE